MPILPSVGFILWNSLIQENMNIIILCFKHGDMQEQRSHLPIERVTANQVHLFVGRFFTLAFHFSACLQMVPISLDQRAVVVLSWARVN